MHGRFEALFKVDYSLYSWFFMITSSIACKYSTVTGPAIAVYLSQSKIVGALIAASTDLSFNLYGYLAVTLNNFLTALYLVMVKKVPGYQGLTSTGILFYTAGLSIPMLVAALLLTREPWHLKYYPNFFSHGFRVSTLDIYPHCVFRQVGFLPLLCKAQHHTNRRSVLPLLHFQHHVCTM